MIEISWDKRCLTDRWSPGLGALVRLTMTWELKGNSADHIKSLQYSPNQPVWRYRPSPCNRILLSCDQPDAESLSPVHAEVLHGPVGGVEGQVEAEKSGERCGVWRDGEPHLVLERNVASLTRSRERADLKDDSEIKRQTLSSPFTEHSKEKCLTVYPVQIQHLRKQQTSSIIEN